jgi:hypothetical protein
VSEPEPNPVNGDSAAASAGATPPQPATSPSATAAEHVESPKLVPGDGAEAPTDAASSDAGPTETARETTTADTPRPTGEMIIMAPYQRDQSRSTDAGETGSDDNAARVSGLFGKRRLAAIAAVLALAAVSGAVGGALMMAGLGQFQTLSGGSTEHAALQSRATEDGIARLDADLTALKKTAAAQSARLSDRIDKVEKAEAEPAAKLAKLSELVEKLHAAPMPVPGPVASVPSREATTGSIQPPPAAPAKPEIARLPTVEGWVLRDVANGSAIIEGRQGLYEVFAGDPIPGLGRVEAIRRQDGRWVVVTSKGLIVAR